MVQHSIDLAQVRLDNALALFEEFVRATARHADAATLRGLEGRFAERMQIQPSYWSQIKSRSRQIGERLARQFEQRGHKPVGWMDQPHGPAAAAAVGTGANGAGLAAGPPVNGADPGSSADENLPRDADERFIVGLVLTYYRRHPQRARTRLLDLLGEVLVPATPAAATAAAPDPRKAAAAAATTDAARDAQALWARTRAAVAPLKRKT